MKSSPGRKVMHTGTCAMGNSAVTGRSKGTAVQEVSYRMTGNKNCLQDKKLAALAKVPGKGSQRVAGRGIQKEQAAVLSVSGEIQGQTEDKKEAREGINQESESYARYQKIKAKKGKGIVKKQAVLKIAGAAASQYALKQMEGGEEARDSCRAAAVLASPAVGAVNAGKQLCQAKAVKAKKQKIKQVQSGSRVKQKETADDIKTAGRNEEKTPAMETGQNTGNDVLQQTYGWEKQTRPSREKSIIKPVQKIRKAGIHLHTKKMAQKETGILCPGLAKDAALNRDRLPQVQLFSKEFFQETGNSTVGLAKPEETQATVKQPASPRHIAVKKVSFQRKREQRQADRIKKQETASFVKYSHNRKTDNTRHMAAEKKIKQDCRKRRMVQLFVDRFRQEEKKGHAGKVLKDTAKARFFLMVKQMGHYAGVFFLSVAALMAIVVLPVLLVVAVLYNSPFAIFFPSISSGDTTQDVLSVYMQEFNQEVDGEVFNSMGYSNSQKVYVNAPAGQVPDNYCDILAVYMVKHGIGDTATDMTDQAKENLEAVFDDMCSYSVSISTNVLSCPDGSVIVLTTKNVNVVLKNWEDMVSVYNFSQEEQELLVEIMKPENLALLGYDGNQGTNPGAGILPGKYQAVLDAVSDENGRNVLAFALSKVGYPYSQALRDSGTHFDCSSLAYYAWKNAGVDISYQGANTAAAEGQYCYVHNLLVRYDEMQPGDLIFYSYQKNGRFLDISHVAVYAGNGMVVEAANTNLGVVYRPVQGKNSIVLIGRPR